MTILRKKLWFQLLGKSQTIILLTLLGGVINYIFQIILAKELSIVNYGYFSAIWSLLAAASLITSGFQNQSTVATTKSLDLTTLETKTSSFVGSVLKVTSLASILIFANVLVFFDEKVQSKIGIMLVCVSVPISGLTAVVLGRLLGWKGPVPFLQMSLVLALTKLILAYFILIFSENVNLLIFILLLKQLIVSTVVLRYENRHIPKLSGKIYEIESLAVVLTTTLFWGLVYLDVPLFRLNADEVQSGMFSALSNLSKIPIILSASANSFLLSSGILKSDNKDNRKIIKVIFFGYLIIYAICIITFHFFGKNLVKYTIGAKYFDYDLLISQLISYFPLYLLGLLLVTNFQKIRGVTMSALVVILLAQLIVLMNFKLSTKEFLLTNSFFIFAMCIVLLSVQFFDRLRKSLKIQF